MQSNKILNHKSIDALGTILLLSINKGEEYRVLDNLIILSKTVENIFALSTEKFEQLLLNEEHEKENNSYWEIEKNYSSSFNSILALYSQCIKTAIESKRINIALEFKNAFGKIIRRYLFKMKDIMLFQIYFRHQESLFKYCIDIDNGLSNSFGYHWYYDLTFDCTGTYGKFDLDYLEMFDKQIFKYIQYSIDENNIKWLNGWIDWLHNGIGFMDSNRFSFYEYFGVNSGIENEQDIEEKFNNITSKKTYEDFAKTLTELNEEWKGVDTLNIREKDEKLNKAIKTGLTVYLFQNTKQLLFSSLSYGLYKNNYDLVFKLLNINRSSKSEVIVLGHTVLPQNLTDIMKLWIKEDIYYDDERWKFHFGKVFRENNHYESMLTFILITNLELNQISNNKNFNIREMMFLKDKIDYLLEKLNELNSYENVFTNIHKDKDKDFYKIKINIKDILTKQSKYFETRIDKEIDNSDISEIIVNEFKDAFYEEYVDNEEHIKNKLSKLSNHFIEKKDFDLNINKFGLKDTLPRRIFVKETETQVDYIGSQFASDFIYSQNTEFTKKVLVIAKEFFINDFDKTINNIGIDNILILTTNHSEILDNNDNFKHSWEINNINHLVNPDGYYLYKKENIPIFSYYTNLNDAKTILLNKEAFFTWIDYFPTSEKENVKEYIYLHINDNNESNEKVTLDLYDKYDLKFDDNFECFVMNG